ncbi:MAG: RNA ligase family protein, partial [Candidatus Berkelbacteria bacterium]|nr:RNA ligase family protein [Candidatus Berkelbacteria bacterium]
GLRRQEMQEMVNNSWHSYPKIYALGHNAVTELLFDPVIVEEKVDGSQFSFGLFEDGYRARSKGAVLNIIAPEKMFAKACEVVQGLPLKEGWTYRAEYLLKPKHNALAYDRTPKSHLIIFDINTGEESYMSWEAKAEEAARLGLEVMPKIFEGVISEPQMFRDMLETVSCLGGQKIEGVVIKNYKRFGLDKKVLMGKFVSEAFKEVHKRTWAEDNPTSKDILERLIESYRTPARWNKAIQHLNEKGLLESSPRDIGNLIKEVGEDVELECVNEIKESLYRWAWPHIRRGLNRGLPEWYKEELVKKQFEKDGCP